MKSCGRHHVGSFSEFVDCLSQSVEDSLRELRESGIEKFRPVVFAPVTNPALVKGDDWGKICEAVAASRPQDDWYGVNHALSGIVRDPNHLPLMSVRMGGHSTKGTVRLAAVWHEDGKDDIKEKVQAMIADTLSGEYGGSCIKHLLIFWDKD